MLLGIITQGPAFSHREAHRWNRRIELSLPRLQKEKLSVRALCHVFLPASSSHLCPWKISFAQMTDCHRAGHRLLLWDESLLAFFWVTGTICPSSWGRAGWSKCSPGMLFSFLFGISDLAAVAVWCGGWFGMTCFVPCSAAKPGHNLIWLTYCIAGDMFCCKADGFKINIFNVMLLLHHIRPGVSCFSCPSLFRTLILFSTCNKNLEGNSEFR